MNSFERVLTAINHKEPDRVPFDLGGTESSSIDLKAYAKLRHNLNLPEKEPEILSFGGQLAKPDEDLCQLLGVDTRRVTRRNLSTWRLNLKDDADSFWFTDEWGVTSKMPKHYGHTYNMASNPLR